MLALRAPPPAGASPASLGIHEPMLESVGVVQKLHGEVPDANVTRNSEETRPIRSPRGNFRVKTGSERQVDLLRYFVSSVNFLVLKISKIFTDQPQILVILI